jgi:iron(III) transport system ATP-binding protein
MLEIQNLSKKFGDFTAVDCVNISVPDGSFLVLLGPSGCGKTTLLRMLAGLELPSAGQLIFGDQLVSDGDKGWNVDPANRRSGLVFQSYALWPHMSVRGNVDWPLKVAKMAKKDRVQRIDEVLKLLGIEKLANRFPNEISGGQQQRVAIARTIAPRPEVLLFDEPLSNLDAKLRVEMRAELMRLHRKIGATSVYVTHDQIEAMTMATHVAVMNEGKIEQFGTPEDLVQRPNSTFVANFVGTPPANIIPVISINGIAKVENSDIQFKCEVPDVRSAMFRAEDISLSQTASKNTLALEVSEVSGIAGRTMVTALAGSLRLTSIVDEAPKLQVDDLVYFVLPDKPACWFDQAGKRI